MGEEPPTPRRPRRSSVSANLPPNYVPPKRGPEEFVKHCLHARDRYLKLVDADARQQLNSTYSSFASVGLQKHHEPTFAHDSDCLLAGLALLATLSDPDLLALGPETVSDSGGMTTCQTALEYAAEFASVDVGLRTFTVRPSLVGSAATRCPTVRRAD